MLSLEDEFLAVLSLVVFSYFFDLDLLVYFFTPKKRGGRLDFVYGFLYFLRIIRISTRPITIMTTIAAAPIPKTYVSVIGAGVGSGGGGGSGATTVRVVPSLAPP
jgi:hypothetical protein